MRPGRRLAARGALAALLAVRAGAQAARGRAAAGGLEDSKRCSPQHDIFRLVLGASEEDYVVDGDPEVSLKTDEQYEHLPRGCRKWVGQETCCKEALWGLVEGEWVAEAEQIHAIRDVYTHLVSDVITPAVEELVSRSQEDLAQQLAEVAATVEEGRVGEAVAGYIDGCEDPIRLHFAATTCELCDPAIAPKLLEGKYMEVSADACTGLWHPCSESVSAVEAAAGKLAGAAAKLKAIVDAGVKSEKVVHAQSWIDGAAHQTSLAVRRIGFYKDKTEFCKRLQDKGYAYDPKDWGDLDLLHPGLAKQAVKQEEAEKREEAVLASRATTESRDAQCVHGWLRGEDCFCQPCWEGLYCEIPAKPGPMRAQPFSPLVADNVMGSQQPLPIVGCEMPRDLSAQLARIKLLPVKRAGHNKQTTVLANEEDPCPRMGPPAGSFREVPLQIPISASETRLEFLVQATQGSEGLYAVCYCFGPECLTETSSWWITGHVKVVRTDGQASEEEQVELVASERDPHAHQAKTGPVECDSQWKALPMPSIAYTETSKDAVAFECRPGFSDRVGPAALQCSGGAWHAVLEAEEGGAPNATVPWDRQLPRCRWGHRDCAPPLEDGRLLGGGAVEIEDGAATYTCPFGSTMLVDATHLKLKTGDRVAMKATPPGDTPEEASLTAGEIVQPAAGGAGNGSYDVRWKGKTGDDRGMANPVNASELWLVLEEGSFQSFCQADKSWAPAVGMVSCKGEKGAQTANADAEARGAVASHTQVASLSSTAGGGPCGGSFGVPEVRRGEAVSLVEALLPQPRGLLPETASLLELGKAEQPELRPSETPGAAGASLLELGGLDAAEAQEATQRGASPRELAGAGDSMLELGGQELASAGATRVTGRHSPSSSSRAGSRPLGIRKWPVRFTKDPARSFVVDRCWTTRDCSAPGAAPRDTAAAQEGPASKKVQEPGRHPPSIRPLAAILIFAVLLAFVLLRSLWLSLSVSGVDKHLDKAPSASATAVGFHAGMG